MYSKTRMALPIFTIESFNQNTLQAAGAVFAQRVETVSLLRDLFAGIGGIIGGRSTTMEKKMDDLTKVLLEEIQANAISKYPNAVALIDLKLLFSDIGKTQNNMFLAGQASATVLIRKVGRTSQPIDVSQPTAMAPIAPTAMAPNAVPVVQPIGGKRKSKSKTKSKTRKNRY